jgi:thiol-disulfide isomerase/thioredoxin
MRTLITAACLALSASLLAQGKPTLKIGSVAPPLAASKWVKGTPVSKFAPGSVYVVEFWATWCGPCIEVMPHLTALQKKYPQVPVLAFAVSDEAKAVEAFVKKNPAKMGYQVAIDNGQMSEKWMKASGQMGIPVAFIVGKDGKIEWIGHSGGLDEPLAQVVSGRWNRTAAIKEHERALAEVEKANIGNYAMQALYEDRDYDLTIKLANAMIKDGDTMGHQRKIQALLRKMDGTNALKEISVVEKKGRYKSYTPTWRYQALVMLGRYAEAQKLGAKLVAEGDAYTCRRLAWDIIDPEMPYKKRDLALAQKAVNKALADDRGPANLRTQAWIYHFQGNAAKAKSTHAQALKLMEDPEINQKWAALFKAHAG